MKLPSLGVYTRFGPDITKLYISHFLTGIVLWYGVEKLFMASIGIDAWGVGVATAVFLIFSFLLDIPSGIIADRWSRKGLLVVAALSLALSSVIFGTSNSLLTYGVGEVFYALYFVAASGTYQALIYDLLHEKGQTKAYSKIAGGAFSLFFFGAALTSALGGFIASIANYELTFFFTIIPCILNAIILLSIREPTFHKAEQKEKALRELGGVLKLLTKNAPVRILTFTLSVLAIVEVFKSEFGQLLLARYLPEPEVMGLLWALYSLTWAIGSFVAYRFKDHLNLLLAAAVIPYCLMALTDTWLSIPLFMVQAAAMAAFTNRVETHIQNNTPSSVRASLLSILSSMGRIVSVPASFAIGWVISRFDVLWGLRLVAIVALITAVCWLLKRQTFKSVTTEPSMGDAA